MTHFATNYNTTILRFCKYINSTFINIFSQNLIIF